MHHTSAPRIESLSLPPFVNLVDAEPGDIVRLVRETDGSWFYCRVEEGVDDDNLILSVVDAQSWPSLLVDGIRPGVRYLVAREHVLSVVSRARS